MKEEFYKKKLKNGLTVLFEKRKLPLVSVSCSVKFGQIHESMKNKGIAHVIEHMTFKGTKKRNYEEIAKEIKRKGGVINAFTSEEYTSFLNKLPSKHIKTGLDIASDLILNPKFNAVEFKKEKKVILEEIKMIHDNPRYYVVNKIKEMLYKKPFGEFGIGTAETVKSLTRNQLVELFNKVYTTDSMILCVVGDADFEEICRFGETFPFKNRKLIQSSPVKINKQETEKRKGIDQSHFVFGFHSPDLNDKRRYGYELMMTYLAGGMSSVLFNEIREKRGLAYTVNGEIETGERYGYSIIYVGTMKEKIREIKEIILKQIRNLKNLDKKDFDEVKEQLIGSKELLSEDSMNVMNLLVQEELNGNAEEYYKYEERINGIKLEDVKDISKLKNFSAFSLVPK